MQIDQPNEEILTVTRASMARRWLGVGMVTCLALILLYIVIYAPPGGVEWTVFLISVAMASAWMAQRMYQATQRTVVLTGAGLQDDLGEVIVPLENIASLERGVFAMKPSNGFLVRLKTKMPRRWQPGLWWRHGRKVGIGGVTPGSETKVMAQMLEAMLAERNAAADND